MDKKKFRIAALYKFGHIKGAEFHRGQLKALCLAKGVTGTLIIAEEGINGTIAGSDAAVGSVLAAIAEIEGLGPVEVKESWSEQPPFPRMKVHFKPEIVTMGTGAADPRKQVGTYVEPDQWNALIAEPGVVLIDTRNHYESRIGAFSGALCPDTRNFREFPAWVEAHKKELEAATKIVMYCTGGIRCERGTAHMLEQGFDSVFHLHGGILRYLETVDEADSRWEGECFVFDDRVSIKHGLHQGDHDICHACREPINAAHKASPDFVLGVSCPLCVDRTTDEQKRGYAERQKQIQLAKDRDSSHIGPQSLG
jgi:UPF0176 protein